MSFTYQQPPQTLFSLNTDRIETENNTMNFYAGSDKMLTIAHDGFYVRGVKIEQDENEAKKVYDSFTQWLAWAQLQRNS